MFLLVINGVIKYIIKASCWYISPMNYGYMMNYDDMFYKPE